MLANRDILLVLRAFTSFLSPMIPLADVLTLENFETDQRILEP